MAKRKPKIKKLFLIKRKDIKLGITIGILVGVIGVIIVSSIFYFFIVGIIDFGQGDLLRPFLDKQITEAYENVGEYWQESEFVKSLSYVCSLQKTELDKVRCVHHYINSTFNYTNHGIGNQLRESPEEMISIGGICRDWAVMSASLMKNLNINYEFIHELRHVYLKVYPDNYTCRLDMKFLICEIKIGEIEI